MMLRPALLSIAITLASFGAAASWILLLRLPAPANDGAAGFNWRMLVKALFFSGVLAIALFALARRRMPPSPCVPASHDAARGVHAWGGLGLVLLVAAAVAFPNVSLMPRAEPDELHHLIVCRNLAEYGIYGSGHPSVGFTPFDEYDSVGVTVLGPIAAAFKLAGASLAPARIVLGLYFLFLCLACHQFLRTAWGDGAACAAVAAMIAAPMTPYLARTLYGEVPALFFLVGGLILWRKALAAASPLAWSLLAGAAIGLAILSKTFLVISAFAFLGAIAYDAATFRTIRWAHVWPVAFGAGAVFFAWQSYAALHAPLDAPQSGTGLVAMYRYLLTFGFDSTGKALGWFAKQPLTTLANAAGLALCAPFIFGKKYDPASVTLFLFALLTAFWFAFFTPAHIQRYLWYTCALSALALGAVCWRLLLHVRTTASPRATAGVAVLLLLAAGTSLVRTYPEVRRMYVGDEVSEDLAIAEYVASLPEGTRAATAYWPVERAANFYGDRCLPRFVQGEDYDVIIVNLAAPPKALNELQPEKTIGRYGIIHGRR